MTGLGAAQPLAACNRAGSGCDRRGPTSGLQLTRPGPAVGCMPPAARFRGAAGGVEPTPDLGPALHWREAEEHLLSYLRRGSALARRCNTPARQAVARARSASGDRHLMASAARISFTIVAHLVPYSIASDDERVSEGGLRAPDVPILNRKSFRALRRCADPATQGPLVLSWASVDRQVAEWLLAAGPTG
jgi:hypothetical protein